jgi:hypothetical protein
MLGKGGKREALPVVRSIFVTSEVPITMKIMITVL